MRLTKKTYAALLMLSTITNVNSSDLTDTQIREIEQKIQYTFVDKKLLKHALTHTSHTDTNGFSTQFRQFEWLGDATLNLAVTSRCFDGSKPVENLNKFYESKISNVNLALVFTKLGLTPYVRANAETLKTGANSVYADALEAIVGAIQKDAKEPDDGLRQVIRFVDAHVMHDSGVGARMNQTTPPQTTVTAAQKKASVVSDGSSEESTNNILTKKEVSQLRPQADAGNKEAQHKLALHYIDKESYQEAWKWLYKLDTADAWFEMAELVDMGHDDSKNYYSAETLYKKAADAGNTDACYEFGRINLEKCESKPQYYSAGYFGPSNPLKDAIDYFYEAAFADSEAKSALIDLYQRAQLPTTNQRSLAYHLNLFNGKKDMIEYWMHIDRAYASDLNAMSKIADLLLTKKVTLQNNKGEQTGFNWLVKVSKNGSVEDTMRLAECYAKGTGTVQDLTKALECYKHAADRGHAAAQYKVGVCYEEGIGVAKDNVKANTWYTKAEANGHIEAKGKLSLLKQKSEYEQLISLKKRAVAREMSAPNQLGTLLESKREDADAFFWYNKAAEQQDLEGMYNLARMYHFGRGIEKNERTAKEWYKKAADKGHLNAKYHLAELHAFGIDNAKTKKASEYAKIAVADPEYYGYSNNTYRNGNNEIQKKIDTYRENISKKLRNFSSYYGSSDEREAFALYQSLATGGDTRAQKQLGVMHYLGKGTRENKEEAVKWWTKAADLGDIEAKTYLGVMYTKGHGVAKDESKAIPLLQEAADLGETHAMYNLALLYAEGKGVPQDATKAMQLLTQGVEYLPAQSYLLWYRNEA